VTEQTDEKHANSSTVTQVRSAKQSDSLNHPTKLIIPWPKLLFYVKFFWCCMLKII